MQLALDERDRLLIAAAGFYPGHSGREIARQFRVRLSRYRNGRWRRDRTELTCPLQYRGTLTQVLWMILKTRDAIPGDRTIRSALRDLP
ncbi:hypothetical protein JQ633_06705 [Bradyrhizobium tropiciagri]|uniref:hypothetical protein n=1 Tax=Bradyrhizobium tropiciagri TaxID=312253 RepID=UPI001BAC5670|nr:hypothetical protein [Bradyrhizobium tropiciagri]MBR0870040.1 hypothetical protein [Bradyrhizobium tropiciagri]